MVPLVRAYHRLKRPCRYRDPFEVIWVDPMRISKHTDQRRYRKYAHILRIGIEKPGDWDLEQHDLTGEQLFVMLEKRFRRALEWEEIDEYKQVRKDIEQGKRRLKCDDTESLHKKLMELEAMAGTIKEHGYKTQRQLGSVQIWDEIRVGLSRNNELLFIDGRNRLAVARALRLEKIPVIIAMKHPRANMPDIEQ